MRAGSPWMIILERQKRVLSFSIHQVYVNVMDGNLQNIFAWGKLVISTPLTREMPAPLEHGKHVHFVNSVDEIYDAVVKINSDEHYRKKLQEGARQYYVKWIAPEVVIQRLLEKVGEQL